MPNYVSTNHNGVVDPDSSSQVEELKSAPPTRSFSQLTLGSASWLNFGTPPRGAHFPGGLGSFMSGGELVVPFSNQFNNTYVPKAAER